MTGPQSQQDQDQFCFLGRKAIKTKLVECSVIKPWTAVQLRPLPPSLYAAFYLSFLRGTS
jgi:hypothetical protein